MVKLEHDTPCEFFENNVRSKHGYDAEGEVCDMELETEFSGPVYPPSHELAGQYLRCTCGYEQFEAALREFHPGLFREDFE